MPLTVNIQFRSATLPSVPFDMDFSNDGTLLACATQTDPDRASVIQILRTQDGSVLTTFMQSVKNGRGVAFIADGRELVFIFERDSQDSQLYRIALNSREPTLLQYYPPSARNRAIVRDLRASRFAVIGSQVEIWDTGTNKILQVLPGATYGEPIHAAFSRDGSHIYVYGTVEGSVVRYEVDTARETGRWDAPTPFGAQVVVSPDERYLLVAAASHRGMYVYDIVQNKRIIPPSDSYLDFDLESVWRPWAFTQDSKSLLCLMGAMWNIRLPNFADLTSPDDVLPPSIHSWIAASAWEAPLVGFGTAEDATVRWFELISDSAGDEG